MTELVLTYVGAVLIAMEFVRKFTKVLALMDMLVAWPVSSLFGENGLENWSEIYKAHKLNVIFRVTLSLILGIITLPFTLVSYVLWFIILALNSFHNWVNRLYSKGLKRYRPFYLLMIGLLLFALSGYKKYPARNRQKVMQEIDKEIPILPLIGIILITIAFIMEITK